MLIITDYTRCDPLIDCLKWLTATSNNNQENDELAAVYSGVG